MFQLNNFHICLTLAAVLSVVAGCSWLSGVEKYDCRITEYVGTSLANRTGRDVEVFFCSPDQSIARAPRTSNANSDQKPYHTTTREYVQRTDGPTSYSNGDACSKMVGPTYRQVGSQVPYLSPTDQITTKICTDDLSFELIDIGSNCSLGFRLFDPNTVACK